LWFKDFFFSQARLAQVGDVGVKQDKRFAINPRAMAVESTSGTMASPTVIVHPLVLLSVVDHYARVAKDTKKRTVGILLGQKSQGRIDVTNSYAVPFEVQARPCVTPPANRRRTRRRIHSLHGDPTVE
jgi:hypothetical protein